MTQNTSSAVMAQRVAQTFLDGRVTLHPGDCLDVVRLMPACSVDAVVTDPPYALVSIGKRFGADNAAPCKAGKTGAYQRASAGFMGKKWDNGSTAFAVEFWAEILRVLKPGGHVVAFGGTRTYHRLACAIEDAGFEIRDALMWHYGTGFPKSHDVSKQLDLREKKYWQNVLKAIDKLDTATILGAWKEFSEHALSAGIQFPKSETEIGTSTPRSDFAVESVLLSVNHERSPAHAIVAALRLKEARHIDEGTSVFAPLNAASGFMESSVRVSIAGLSAASLKATRSGISIAHADVRVTLGESTPYLDKGVEALTTWLGKDQSFKSVDTAALCAELTDALKRITLSQCESFQNLDTKSQTDCVSATTVTITESTAALLISFMVATLRRKGIDRAAGAEREPTGEIRRASIQRNGTGETWDAGAFASHPEETKRVVITAPATDDARKWAGWGTALKPATEIIAFARKPPSEGTVAANVLRWGTGAINVDGCRIEGEPTGVRNNNTSLGSSDTGVFGKGTGFVSEGSPLGRWPANLLTDGSAEVVAMFPDSKGQQGDLNETGKDRPTKTCFGDMAPPKPHAKRNDSGSAARFFFSAKANRNDRCGSKHPTVKPVDLMRWLCRLITPPGGTVIDPFAGTGSTGEAAFLEGFSALLIEREAEYLADISRRMAHVFAPPRIRKQTSVTARGRTGVAGPLFAADPADSKRNL